MLQCKDCEHFNRDEKTGQITMRCDPFGTVKEPACLAKMQLLRMDALLRSYQMMLQWYQKLAPMQEKMFGIVNREMEEYEDSESWKYQNDEDEKEKKDEDDQANGLQD